MVKDESPDCCIIAQCLSIGVSCFIRNFGNPILILKIGYYFRFSGISMFRNHAAKSAVFQGFFPPYFGLNTVYSVAISLHMTRNKTKTKKSIWKGIGSKEIGKYENGNIFLNLKNNCKSFWEEEKKRTTFFMELTYKSCLVWVRYCLKKSLKYLNKSFNLIFC